MQFLHCVKKGRVEPKEIWMETIRKDMENLELSIDMIYARMKWKERIYYPALNSCDDDDATYTRVAR